MYSSLPSSLRLSPCQPFSVETHHLISRDPCFVHIFRVYPNPGLGIKSESFSHLCSIICLCNLDAYLCLLIGTFHFRFPVQIFYLFRYLIIVFLYLSVPTLIKPTSVDEDIFLTVFSIASNRVLPSLSSTSLKYYLTLLSLLSINPHYFSLLPSLSPFSRSLSLPPLFHISSFNSIVYFTFQNSFKLCFQPFTWNIFATASGILGMSIFSTFIGKKVFK